MGTPNQVVTRGFVFEDFIFTYNVSGTVTTDDVGKAVALDTTAAGTVKLAGDGDLIFGRLETYEDRTQTGLGKVGAVTRKIKDKVPYTGTAPVVGDRVIGGGAGLVKKDTGATVSNPQVVEVLTGFVVIEKL